MRQVSAHAVRHGKTIEVTVLGQLADTCHQAEISDIYPGGDRVYITDPGAAQVFISETVKPGSQICLFIEMPWGSTTEIPDKEHETVEIFINNREVLEVKVADLSQQFIVIGAIESDIGGCAILPADSFYPAIYKRVFGPADYDACVKYAQSNYPEFRPSAILSKTQQLVSSHKK